MSAKLPRLCLWLAVLPGKTWALHIHGNPEADHWQVTPSGPQLQPHGRHIQYLYFDRPHGLSDRVRRHFVQLLRLGRLVNATVHIHGGAEGAGAWLDARHTGSTASHWDRYFNTNAHGGNPWHPLVNFDGCREIEDTDDVALEQVFDGEGDDACVNLLSAVHKYRVAMTGPGDEQAPDLLPARGVLAGATAFLRRYDLMKHYGVCHIRRCDRLRGNAKCTEVDAVYHAIKQRTDITTWVVLTYAEEGYSERLRRRLSPLGLRLLFEDSVVMNEAHPDDNYFSYMVGKQIESWASAIIETHRCGGQPKPEVFLTRENALYLQYKGRARLQWVQQGNQADEANADGAEAHEDENWLYTGAVCTEKPVDGVLYSPIHNQ